MPVCRPVTCRACGRTTWAGCGAHVDQVMAHVPVDQRCDCAPEDRRRPSLIDRLLGR